MSEIEVNAGIAETKLTRLPYFLSFVRHIDSIHQKLHDPLAPKYFDIIEHNNIRTVDRLRTRRLMSLKVRQNPLHLLSSDTAQNLTVEYCRT